MKYLSRAQQIALLDAAGRAYARQVADGRHTPRTDLPRSKDMTLWRHAVQREEVGQESLTMCVNADFEALMGRFLTLAGEDDKAYAYLVRSTRPAPGRGPRHAAMPDTVQNREQLTHKIKAACAELDKPFPFYARAILKRQTGSDVLWDNYSAAALLNCLKSLTYAVQRLQRAENCPF